MPKPLIEPEPAPAWSDFPILTRRKFDKLTKAIYDLKLQRLALVKSEKALMMDAKPLMEALFEAKGVKSVQVGELRATLSVRAGQLKIDGKKLLEEGVDSAVIQKCTTQGKGSTSLLISGPKDEDTDE